MIHVVGAETGPHELLHQVRLFVGALRRAEAGQCLTAVAVTDPFDSRGDDIEGLFPAGLAKMAIGISRVHLYIGILGCVFSANERNRQAMRVCDVVEAEPTLDA